VLFPEDVSLLTDVAKRASLILTGPQGAFWVQGDDKLGAFADIHRMLADAHINVYASKEGLRRAGSIACGLEGSKLWTTRLDKTSPSITFRLTILGAENLADDQ